MHDDQLRSLLRTLEDGPDPNPAFADALYARLQVVRSNRGGRRSPLLLLAAAVLLATFGTALAVGTGLIRLPFVVSPSPSPSASASGLVVASGSPAPSASVPAPSDSAAPSVTIDPELAGRVLWAEADGLRLRPEPSEGGEISASLRRGQLMGTTGGRTTVDGIDWYEVRIGPGDLAGWVAGGPDGAWLRLVDDGAVTFRCDGCGDVASLVSVTPLGDASISTLGDADQFVEWRWSPDGSRLAAARGGTTLPYRVVLLDETGAELADLGIGATPTWSPDGTRLAWSGEEGLVVTDGNLVPTTLDLGGLAHGAPFWSPDGTRLAIIAAEDPGIIDPPVSLYVVPVEGGDPRRVVGPGTLNGITWAPDGSRLGFSTVDLSGEQPDRAFVVPVGGGEPEPLIGGGGAQTPIWSPDGARLALITPDGLLLADGDGTAPDVLVPSESGLTIGEVSWSPSGSWLLYFTSTGGEPTMWIVAADGSVAPRAISPAGAAAQQADWQPILSPMP